MVQLLLLSASLSTYLKFLASHSSLALSSILRTHQYLNLGLTSSGSLPLLLEYYILMFFIEDLRKAALVHPATPQLSVCACQLLYFELSARDKTSNKFSSNSKMMVARGKEGVDGQNG